MLKKEEIRALPLLGQACAINPSRSTTTKCRCKAHATAPYSGRHEALTRLFCQPTAHLGYISINREREAHTGTFVRSLAVPARRLHRQGWHSASATALAP
jgi:hypothetical protein